MIAGVCVTVLTVNVLCSIFTQPRVFMRMSRDGLLYAPFGKINPKTKVPTLGIVITGVLAGAIAFVFDVNQLSNMISIGTLMAFSTVCAGVILLRVEHASKPHMPLVVLLLYLIPATALAVSLRHLDTVHMAVPIAMGVLMLGCMLWLWSFGRAATGHLAYLCPLIPFLPMLGIFSNIYLICSLDFWSYVRVGVWTVIGFVIYFTYGIFHSTLNPASTLYRPLLPTSDGTDSADGLGGGSSPPSDEAGGLGNGYSVNHNHHAISYGATEDAAYTAVPSA